MTAPSPSAARAAVDQLEGLLAGSTPGEWSRWDAPDCTAVAAQVQYTNGVPSNPLFWVGSQMTYRDAELIVAMHRHLPHLLAAVKAVDELADQLERTSPKPQAGGFFAEELRDTLRAALALAAVDVTETAK